MLSSDFVNRCIRSLGNNLSPELCEILAHDVEFRIFDLAQDVLRVSQVLKHRSISVSDINAVLRIRHEDAIFGRSHGPSLKFHSVSDLLYEADVKVHVDSMLASEHKSNLDLVPVPQAPSLLLSWLAVEGKLVKSPLVPTDFAEPLVSVTEDESLGLDPSGVGLILPVRHTLSKELNEYFARLLVCLKSVDVSLRHAALASLNGDTGLYQLIPYLCFYVSELVSQYLMDTSLEKSIDFPRLPSLIAVIKSLSASRYVDLSNYLHYICPCLCSIILADQIPALTFQDFSGFHVSTRGNLIENFDWKGENFDQNFETTVRCFAADCLAFVVLKFGKKFSDLKDRVISLITPALNNLSKFSSFIAALVVVSQLSGASYSLQLIQNLRNLENFDEKFHRIKAIVSSCLLPFFGDSKFYSEFFEIFDVVPVVEQSFGEQML
ncbi:hypothetical protein RCL1_009160 [Eukaryota sp. TZLM3-RCL]